MAVDSEIAQGMKQELRAKLAAPSSAAREGGIAAIRGAIHEANQISRGAGMPPRLDRWPQPMRPVGRMVARLARLALLPYLSRQRDFNHHVVVALEQVAHELERNQRR